MLSNRLRCLFFVLVFGVLEGRGLRCCGQESTENPPDEPVIATASDEAEQAITSFRLSDKLRCELVAAEPMVANPVAFNIDGHGRIFVCETFRQELGVTDNRSHDETWIDHDLAAQTVQDRIAYHKKLLPNGGADYTRKDDRIRLLRDADGDGKIDSATVFADRFNSLEDGTAAGVLALDDAVLLTCIPSLWRLRDADGDGRAESRERVLSGFGVRVAFRGHDLHGLTRGIDGRIYFSVGDRGYHIFVARCNELDNPESGGVFRCEPDGSQLEVVATGLRNPQELAFNQFGDLFTGDNNSDSGDRARWVYVVPGSDCGWRMAYQYLPDRGPFNREKIWQPPHREQPAYIVPPIANLGDGPSGLAYYPGTGFAQGFEDCFFLCDFRGTSAVSGIRAIRLKPHGAFFEVAESREPVWQILATDAEFGPDGYLYASDWVEGWVGEGKGRIYRFGDPDVVASEAVREVHRLLAGELRQRDDDGLLELLGHADRRVRLEAQFELVRRGATKTLTMGTEADRTLLCRVHALLGLWRYHFQNTHISHAEFDQRLRRLANDPEVEVRNQVARILAEWFPSWNVSPVLRQLLADTSPRVQASAALALNQRGGDSEQLEVLLRLLASNDDRDPIIRHAVIMGLQQYPDREIVDSTLHHESTAVRRAAVVALRRQKSESVVAYLADSDVLVAEEAARAVHDVPIEGAINNLMPVFDRFPQSIAFTHRVLNAAYRTGTLKNAQQVLAVGLDKRFGPTLRREALQMLSHWEKPSSRDRVLGMWRPIPIRSGEPAAQALAAELPRILASGDESLIEQLLRSVASLRIRAAAGAVREVFDDTTAADSTRALALQALVELGMANLDSLLAQAVADAEPAVRIAARRAWVRRDPIPAAASLEAALTSNDQAERQAAFGLLSELPSTIAAPLALREMDRLLAGGVPEDSRLELVSAARGLAGDNPELADRLAEYDAEVEENGARAFRECLAGGDAGRGRTIFFERVQVSCLRCHKIGDQGGAVGPDLTAIGAAKDRRYLLEAIVDPNRAIAEKFETVVILDDRGKTISGIVQAENDDFLRVMTAEGNLVTVAKDRIDERRRGKSAMPEDVAQHLSPSDVRDLVEFLARQAPPPARPPSSPAEPLSSGTSPTAGDQLNH
jgi:quinoprotein glucose dehydrogenase